MKKVSNDKNADHHIGVMRYILSLLKYETSTSTQYQTTHQRKIGSIVKYIVFQLVLMRKQRRGMMNSQKISSHCQRRWKLKD